MMNTTDLCDDYIEEIKVALPIGLQDFGDKKSFYGEIVSIKCFENNPLIREVLSKDGSGKVLIVDGGASLRCALMGDNIAEMALENHWEGIIINGCIRDRIAISKLNIGVKALNVNPAKSFKNESGDLNIKVNFANVDFIPGNFVYADEDGIVVSQRKLH